MNLGDTMRSGVRWVIAGRAGQDLLHFGLSIVLARLLTPTDFGLLATVQIFTGIANFVAGGGMGQALVQAKGIEPRDTHVVFTAQLCICTLIYAFFFMTSPAFAAWFNEPLYEDLMRVSALTFLIRPFSNTPNSLLHRAMRYKATAFANIVILCVTGSVSVLLALLGAGVWSLVLGGIAGGIANAITAAALTRWRPRILFDASTLRRHAGYGLKVSLNDIVQYLRQQSGNFVISRFMGAEAVGLFNKAVSLNDKPRGVLNSAAYKVVFRALAKTQGDLNQSRYLYLRTLNLVSVYTLPIYLVLWWTAEPFIVVVYGSHWAEAAPILRIVMFSVLFDILSSQSGAVTAARRLLGRELSIQIASWVILIIAICIGYRWGASGVAWALVVNAIPLALLMARLAARELQVRPRDILRALHPALALNAVLAAALWVADWCARVAFPYHPVTYTAWMAGIGFLCYALCFLLLPIPQLASEAARWKNILRKPWR
ncbi:MAG: lipopolysaccharide biosynthesis protein [Gammaproteobacteria bacterium]|nr:lipopolysaccharide biosynthesis protein [Gammaproteobacteria bacterium]